MVKIEYEQIFPVTTTLLYRIYYIAPGVYCFVNTGGCYRPTQDRPLSLKHQHDYSQYYKIHQILGQAGVGLFIPYGEYTAKNLPMVINKLLTLGESLHNVDSREKLELCLLLVEAFQQYLEDYQTGIPMHKWPDKKEN